MSLKKGLAWFASPVRVKNQSQWIYRPTMPESFALHRRDEKLYSFGSVLGNSAKVRVALSQQGFSEEEKSVGAERVLGEPGVSAFHMEGVVATGNQSSGLVGGDVVEADGAFGAHEEVFSGDGGELLELGRGEAGVGDGLGRQEQRQKDGVQHVQLVEVWVKKKVLMAMGREKKKKGFCCLHLPLFFDR
ncbi:hypothetical protein V8G54_037980 (chloroplast) [Vigna mungo]|uniref:Uncharacterized protein n=1 Tax=Vigna mungo TaxID=3915 RepID=A0AAQ3RDJ0_VIGMU